MSHKRRGHDGDPNQRAGGGDKRQSRRRKHLYLVLDDWDMGFSIHKIDADTFDSYHRYQSDVAAAAAEHHLPEPPALRLEPPAALQPYPHTDMSFAALGAKLFAFANHRCGLVYDAGTAVLSIGAHAPAHMLCGGSGFSVAAGDDALYVLTYRYFDRQHPHSFHAMSWAPTAPDARQQPTEGWSWNTLPPPPFTSHVHSYALHPDGRTIFVTSSSVSNDTAPGSHMVTYSFDTMDSTWKFHGKWALPFDGQGHYDSELDAWVGIHRDGSVCSCQPVSPSFQSTAPCFYVDCKMTKLDDRMVSQRRMRASLACMGAGKFCLVECVAANNVEKRQPIYGAHDGCVIHLTVFGLKYNHKGELQVKDHRSRGSFRVSRHRYHFGPELFWM